MFSRVDRKREYYDGRIRRFGLDVGAITGGRLVWAVFAPSGAVRKGALAGAYVGVAGEATFGPGVGVNALIGGFRRSITLQPISVQGQTGVSLAVGVADMRLTWRP